MREYTLADLKCQFSIDRKYVFSDSNGIYIRLFDVPRRVCFPPICTWFFKPNFKIINGISIDLTRLDIHSVRIITPDGKYPATEFDRSRDSSLSDVMILEMSTYSYNFINNIHLNCKLKITTSEFHVLNRRIFEPEAPRIEWFFLELTNQCNLSCPWCPQKKMSRPYGKMSLSEAKTILKKIAYYKEQNPILSLTAEIRNPIELHIIGDPLLYPHLFDIIEFGHKLGLDFCLVTNGLLLTKENIKKILESKVRYVILSLSATDPDTYKLTKSSIPYEKIVNQIQCLISDRYNEKRVIPRIEIQFLNTKLQANKAFKVVNNMDQVRDSLVFWSDFVREQEHKYNMILPTQTDQTHIDWESTLDERGIIPGNYFEIGHNIYIVFKHTCNFGNSILPFGYTVHPTLKGQCPFNQANRTFCIFWDGSVSFCSLDFDNTVNIGNVLKSDIKSIWNSPRMNRLRKLMENNIVIETICQKCLGNVEKVSSE